MFVQFSRKRVTKFRKGGLRLGKREENFSNNNNNRNYNNDNYNNHNNFNRNNNRRN